MGLTPELVSILREVKTRDAAGGWKITTTAVATGLLATRNYKHKTSFDRIEEGTHASEGPGVATAIKQFFTFERCYPFTAPFPSVLINDRIQAADGSVWVVHQVRPYEETMQVDCEEVI